MVMAMVQPQTDLLEVEGQLTVVEDVQEDIDIEQEQEQEQEQAGLSKVSSMVEERPIAVED